jgi:peptide/nickel transport system permease protein
MWRFIGKRILVAVPMLLGMALLTFALMGGTPGSYLDTMRLDPQFSKEMIARYEHMYGLDKPWWIQFVSWVKNIVQGRFGYSFYFNIPVEKIIAGRLWNTFVLSFASFFLTWSVAIPLGIWAALNRNRWVDRLIQTFSYISLSVPSFFLVMIFLFLASRMAGVLPLGGMVSPYFDDLSMFGKTVDVLWHLVIPATALSVGSIAGLQRVMRGNMIEALGQKYVLTARAKGLPEYRVVYHHALRNAVNPLITLLGYEFSSLLSGAALTEIICGWPGLGSLMLTAVRSKDVYLVMASMLMGGVLFIVGNLLADIMLAKVDPRIRYD